MPHQSERPQPLEDHKIIRGLIPWNADELNQALLAARGGEYDLVKHLTGRYPARLATAHLWRVLRVTRFFTTHLDRLQAEGLVLLDAPEREERVIARALLEDLAASPFDHQVRNPRHEAEWHFDTEDLLARAQRKTALYTAGLTDGPRDGRA